MKTARTLLWVSMFATGCATLPSEPVERALYIDLTKSVQLSEDSGWGIDRIELEEQAENAMRSACQVDPARRAALAAWLDGQLALAGGPSEPRYRATGELDETALRIERVRALLDYTEAHAAEECPYWIEQDPDFRGRQGDADRFVLLAESQGFGAIVIEGDQKAVGGGGSGRLLLGHGIGPQLTLATGVEVGGTGAFVASEGGKRALETTFVGALPVLLRWTNLSRVFDLEVAPVMRLDTSASPGFRTAFGAGLVTMRNSTYMPYVVLWLGYEYQPPDAQSPADHSLRIGTRVGVDWDP
jgi:hypothetical protein